MAVQIRQGDCRVLAHDIKSPINAIITDPPYGMAFESGSAETAAGKRWVESIAGDDNLEEAVPLFLDVMQTLVERSADECEMFVFTRWQILGEWIKVVDQLTPFVVTNTLVWDKCTPGMGDVEGNWGNTHELIIYAKKGRRRPKTRRSSIISVPRVPASQHIHPTQKPVKLMEILIDMSTNPGDFIVDPFSGSGSTIVAANRMQRHGLGFELMPHFVERSRLRLAQGVFDLEE